MGNRVQGPGNKECKPKNHWKLQHMKLYTQNKLHNAFTLKKAPQHISHSKQAQQHISHSKQAPQHILH